MAVINSRAKDCGEHFRKLLFCPSSSYVAWEVLFLHLQFSSCSMNPVKWSISWGTITCILKLEYNLCTCHLKISLDFWELVSFECYLFVLSNTLYYKQTSKFTLFDLYSKYCLKRLKNVQHFMYCIAELVKAVMLLSCTENHFPYIQLLILYNKYKALKNTCWYFWVSVTAG